MKAPGVPSLFLVFLVFIRLTNLVGANHASFSSNFQIIEAGEDSILSYLETNPLKSDSIASDLLSRFEGTDGYAQGIALYYRGEAAYYLQKWSDAEIYYQEAFNRFESAGDSVRMASAGNNLGLVYLFSVCFRLCKGISLVVTTRWPLIT